MKKHENTCKTRKNMKNHEDVKQVKTIENTESTRKNDEKHETPRKTGEARRRIQNLQRWRVNFSSC